MQLYYLHWICAILYGRLLSRQYGGRYSYGRVFSVTITIGVVQKNIVHGEQLCEEQSDFSAGDGFAQGTQTTCIET